MNLDKTFMPLDANIPDCLPDTIWVRAIHNQSWLAGPGPRAVIWMAGCLRRCPGCMNRAFRSFQTGHKFSVASLAQTILSIPGLRGVTYSGGEPFEQAAPLAYLSRKLREASLSVASYSGYSLQALKSDPDRFGPLLNEIDVLIDGEYRREIPQTSPWVGSGNQQIHLLRNIGGHEDWFTSQTAPDIEISLDDSRFSLAGFSQETQILLKERLRSRGIILGK